MKKEDLFESLQGLDEELLEQSENSSWKKKRPRMLLTAACLVLVVALACVLPMVTNATDIPPWNDVEIVYNQCSDFVNSSAPAFWAHKLKNQLGTQIPLEEEKLRALLSSEFLGDAEMKATSVYTMDGELNYVNIDLCTREGNASSWEGTKIQIFDVRGLGFNVNISKELFDNLERIEWFHYGGSDFVACQNSQEDVTAFYIATWRDDQKFFVVEVETATTNEENAKEQLSKIVWSIANCRAKIDLAIIQEKNYITNKTLSSMEEALKDEDFGAYMLREPPKGYRKLKFKKEFIDSKPQSLSGQWVNYRDELSWQISYYDSAEHESRLTAISERENYDLSLYSETIPAERREILENPIFEAGELTLEAVLARTYYEDEFCCMDFSVRYGDILITVHTKGTDPQWVYEQLKSLAQ